jgi:hypothetical protein
MELACAYEIVLIDCATEIVPDPAKRRIENFGGRVVVCRPGDFCLACANEIDLEVTKAELESEDVRALRKVHGYGVGEAVAAPAVVSLNGIIANFAVTEFLALVTGIREPIRKRLYRGMRGIILENKDLRRRDCYNCGYLVGKRDAANLLRYSDAEAGGRSRSRETGQIDLDRSVEIEAAVGFAQAPAQGDRTKTRPIQ